MDKSGGGKSDIFKNVAMLVASGFLGNAGAHLALAAKDKYDKTRNLRRHWEKIKHKYPEELAGEDETKNYENYESLYSLAPTIAKIPGLSIHFLRMAREYSTGGLDPSTIGTLAKAESDLASAREKGMLGAKLFGMDKKTVSDMIESGSIPTLPMGNAALMGL